MRAPTKWLGSGAEARVELRFVTLEQCRATVSGIGFLRRQPVLHRAEGTRKAQAQAQRRWSRGSERHTADDI